MDHPVTHFTTVFMAFFAIMNPVANAPIFVSLTHDLDPRVRRRIALRSVVMAFALVAAFTFGGRAIFDSFGITLPAFRIAGGALVSLVGFHMVQGRPSSVHAPTEEDNQHSREAALDLAVSPLALPLLAGPGTIATAMSFAADSTMAEITRVLSAFGAMCLVTWGTFLAGQSLTRYIGESGIKVVTRLMGLILLVVGVQMLIAGIGGAVDMHGAG